MTNRKVLWLSRNPMPRKQQEALIGTKYKGIDIRRIKRSIEDVEDLREDVLWADVICGVLPPHLMTQFMATYKELGKPVLRYFARRRVLEDGTATFDFVKWKRVLEYVEIMEDWDPDD